MKTIERRVKTLEKVTTKLAFALALVFIILLLFMIRQDAFGQFRDKPQSAVYLTYQPIDHGLGLRGDYHINYWAGVYGSASYGEWRLYKWSGLDQHVKLTTGVLIPYKDWVGNQHDFLVGINYHWVSGEVQESEIFKDDEVFHNPWSFEMGFTIKWPRFALAFRTDILRWEPCIDIGIPIGRRKTNMRVERNRVGL